MREPQLIQAMTEFNQKISPYMVGHENQIFSPLGLFSLLVLMLEGAQGETRSEIESVLQLPEGSAGLIQEVKDMLRSMEQTNNEEHGTMLATANAAWLRSDVSVVPDFKSTIELIAGEVGWLDFDGQPEESIRQINRWAAEKTRGLVDHVLPENKNLSESVMLLTNVVYFKSRWMSQFGKPIPGKFVRLDGSEIRAAMMKTKLSSVRAYGKDQFFALEIPYLRGTYTFIALLPAKAGRQAFDAMERDMAGLRQEILSKLNRNKRISSIELEMPEFTITGDLDFGRSFKAMGFQNIFSDRADFSGFTTDTPVKVSEIMQNAKIDLNQYGTTAYSFSWMNVIATSALIPPPPPPRVRLDRPFFFWIIHPTSDLVIFAGKLLDPGEID